MSEDETLEEFVANKKEDSSNLELGPIEIDIPDEWESRKLSEMFDLVTGNNYTGEYLSDNDNGGRIFLTLKSVNKGGGFNWDSIKYYTGEVNEREIVESGELLIANTDVTQDGDIVGYSIRVPNFDSGRDIAASMDLSILRPKSDDIAIPYVEYLLQTDYIHSRMRAFSAGSTVLHLNTDLVQSLSLPFPPLPEQRKIATILYTVDRAIEKTEDIIQRATRVRKGLHQTLFRDWSKDTNTDPLVGEYPADWELRILSDVVTVTDAEHFTPDYVESGIPVLRPGDLTPGRISLENVKKRVDEETYEELTNRHTPSNEDIVYSRSQNFAIASQVIEDGQFCLGQDMVAIEPEELNETFLLHLLNSPVVRKQAIRRSTGSTFSRVNLGDIRSYRIPIPSDKVQQKIAKVIAEAEEQIRIEKQAKSQLNRLKRGLMQDLLSGTVRTTDTNIQVPDEIAQHG